MKNHPWLTKKLIEPDRLEETCRSLREKKLSIATLNGSFDLLHAGHLYIIYQASLQADLLIVALNSDQSVKQYKGPKRPIVSLSYRLEMIAALQFVNYVTWFEEPNPCKLLRLIQPNVHVNGAEYGMHCIEAEVVKEYGGRLHLVERIPSLSSSQLINTIKAE